MKLFSSPASPFGRKVLAAAVALGIDGQIEIVHLDANASPAELLAVNPLSKVPALATDDGVMLFDSPVICEYLDSLGDGAALFPTHGGPRWRALTFQALGDGIMDAAVLRRGEQARPAEPARDKVMARQKASVERALAVLERDPPHAAIDIGSLAVACALGYLDFRFAHEPWRPQHPALAAWFETIGQEACLAQTQPRSLA